MKEFKQFLNEQRKVSKMELYLYVVDFDLHKKIIVDGVFQDIDRQNHRNKLNAVLKKMDAGNAELHNLNEAWHGILKEQFALAKGLRAMNESVGRNPEMCDLMEKIDELRTDLDGFHMGGSCWLVISKQGDPDEFVKEIKERAFKYNGEQVIFPSDTLIVTQTKLKYMGMHPPKKAKIKAWLESKGYSYLA